MMIHLKTVRSIILYGTIAMTFLSTIVADEAARNKSRSYVEVETKTWREVQDLTSRRWQAPYTVHYPLQPAFSPDWLFVDRAFNAARFRVYPNISNLGDAFAKSAQTDMFALQFAFGETPFVPDLHQSTLSVPDHRLPLIEGEYFAWDVHYKIRYANAVVEGTNLLGVEVTVTNEGESPRNGAVWCKLNFQKEGARPDDDSFFPYHYVPFHWDRTKWMPSPSVKADGTDLLKDGKIVARINPGDFDYKFIDTEKYSPENRNTLFNPYGIPYYVTSLAHIDEIHQTARLGFQLKPNESRRFEIKVFVDYETDRPSESLDTSFETIRETAAHDFEAAYPPSRTELAFEPDDWSGIFDSMQKGIMQMSIAFPGRNDMVPSQGGSTERHATWTWEAVCMLRPLLLTGHFELVRKNIDYIFTLQDSGVPPQGNFTTVEGAIGTTGPRWGNTTGSALILASEYYLYSQDREFLEKYLGKILRASRWILGEIRATRQMDAEGRRPPWYGLMPFCHATDGNVGYVVTFTDAWSYRGLAKTAELLRSINHPFATELDEEIEQYRNDLNIALRQLAEPDGFINNQIVTGQTGERLWKKAASTCGALHMPYCGVMDAYDDLFQRHMKCVEEKYAPDYFIGKMDRGGYYMGVGELGVQDVYLKRGEWKKAFIAQRTNLLYGMTADAYLTQERFSKADPTFTCWQPNGSGNGRMIEMLLNAIVFDDKTPKREKRLTPLGGIPFDWTRPAPIRLKNLHRPGGGTLTLEVTPQGVLTLEWKDAELPQVIRVPETFIVTKHSGNLSRHGDNEFLVTPGGKSGIVTFDLKDAESN